MDAVERYQRALMRLLERPSICAFVAYLKAANVLHKLGREP